MCAAATHGCRPSGRCDRYIATHVPHLVHHCHRIRSIPAKKYERTMITCLCLPGRSEKIREVVCRFGATCADTCSMAPDFGTLGGSKAPGREGDPRRQARRSTGAARSAGYVVTLAQRHPPPGPMEASQRTSQEATRRGAAGRVADQTAHFAQGPAASVAGQHPVRRAGARYGRQGCRPRPRQVDESFAEVGEPERRVRTAPARLTPLPVASQYLEELPDELPLVRRFDIECRAPTRSAGWRVPGRKALQTCRR